MTETSYSSNLCCAEATRNEALDHACESEDFAPVQGRSAQVIVRVDLPGYGFKRMYQKHAALYA
jgi:hypothetical protein